MACRICSADYMIYLSMQAKRIPLMQMLREIGPYTWNLAFGLLVIQAQHDKGLAR